MIYHVTTGNEWQRTNESRYYSPEAFKYEGFIHACLISQVDGVLQRYFDGKSDLILLEIDESKLEAELRYEVSTGNQSFPHIYGEINKDAIISIKKIRD